MDEEDDITEKFMMTHVEAVANHAFGKELISVQRHADLSVEMVYVQLTSSPGKLIEFDWIEYSISQKISAKDFLDRTGDQLIDYLIKFHTRDGQL